MRQRYHGRFVVRFTELHNTAAAEMLAIQRLKTVVYLCAFSACHASLDGLVNNLFEDMTLLQYSRALKRLHKDIPLQKDNQGSF